jgi:hypothetical protein
MDRAPVSEAGDAGSIPAGTTTLKVVILKWLMVQRGGDFLKRERRYFAPFGGLLRIKSDIKQIRWAGRLGAFGGVEGRHLAGRGEPGRPWGVEDPSPVPVDGAIHTVPGCATAATCGRPSPLKSPTAGTSSSRMNRNAAHASGAAILLPVHRTTNTCPTTGPLRGMITKSSVPSPVISSSATNASAIETTPIACGGPNPCTRGPATAGRQKQLKPANAAARNNRFIGFAGKVSEFMGNGQAPLLASRSDSGILHRSPESFSAAAAALP